MNDFPQTPHDAELPAGEPAAPSTEAPKPAARKRAAKAVETPAVSDPGAAPGGAADAVVVKPRRRRAAPAQAIADELSEVARDVVPLEPMQAAREPLPEPATVTEPSAAHAVLAPVAQAVEAMVAAPLAEADAGPVAAQPATAEGEAPRESPRSRRRGRRERRREEGAAGAEVATFEGAGTADDADGDQDADEATSSEPAEPALPPPQAGEVFAQVLSGEFDTEAPADAAPPAPPKRVLLPDADAPKLHKVLAQAGVGSRRDMEELILDGQITVNGQPAHIGQRISFGDQIKVQGKPVKVRITPPPPRIIAYHKPVGEVVTHDDPQHRPTVFRRLPRLQQGKWQSVGRLDINTEGLLLFTNSGELANQLMHPRFGVEREYAVRVLGMLTPDDRDELLEGVDIEGQKASFQSIEDGGGEGANHWYRVVINEGRNREVRKLFDTQDLTVSRLIRIRYGSVVLPRGLKRGVWVDLENADVQAIRRLVLGDGQRRENGPNARGPERAGGPNKPQRNDRQGGRQNDRSRGPGPQQGGRGRPNDYPGAVHAAAPREPGAERDLDADMDFDPASIPNPLEQTFDKRFVQNPRSPAGGRGFGRGGGGFGAGGSAPAPAPKQGPGPKQPDPLQTSMGYLGADAYHRKSGGGGGGRGGNRGGGGGGGGGGYGGGGGNRGGGGGGYAGGGGGGGGGGRRGR